MLSDFDDAPVEVHELLPDEICELLADEGAALSCEQAAELARFVAEAGGIEAALAALSNLAGASHVASEAAADACSRRSAA